MRNDASYLADIEIPDSDTPCHCDNCDWKGGYGETTAIVSCILTPGDPSPAGRRWAAKP